MGNLRWLGALALAALLLARPAEASLGAARAMALWSASVAPAVFPFLALLPLLTGRDAARAYETLLGGITRRLFALPGAAAPAVAVGMLAGSPAGALAARRAASRAGMTRGELCRLAAAIPGFSPAFLLAVGAMLPDGLAAGRALARSQLAAQLILLALLRGAWRRETGPVPPVPDLPEEQPVRAAVHSALTICGWMALFGALTNALRALAGGPLADGLLMLLDVPSGARLAASLPLGDGGKLVLLAAMCGFGGVCAGLQNLSALRGCGMSAPRFFAVRLLGAGISAGAAAAQLRLPPPRLPALPADPLRLSALAMAALAVPVLLRLRKSNS